MNPENEIQRPAHRLHILHHAAGRKSVEQWMVDELAHHGYRLSLGSPYPMLHAMERNGYLTSRVQREERFGRKLHKATMFGRQRLALAKVRFGNYRQAPARVWASER